MLPKRQQDEAVVVVGGWFWSEEELEVEVNVVLTEGTVSEED